MNKIQPATRKKFITSIIALVVVTLIVIGTKNLEKKKIVAATPQTVASQPAATQNMSSMSGVYKDGTFKATGMYSSPGGTQSVVVSITLAHDTVTDSTAQGQADSGVAQIYQSDFMNNYKMYVTGKKLNTIKLSHVSGSSLTSIGFNSALKQIEKQAKT